MNDDLLGHYSDALDEIYRLRGLLAYEAEGIRAHTEYATFPKSRRAVAAAQIERMTRAARGESELVTAGMRHMQQVLVNAGAHPTLTRYQWEERRGPRRTRMADTLADTRPPTG